MKKLLVTTLLIFLGKITFGQVGGTYIVQGINLGNNSKYSGVCTVTINKSKTYDVVWMVGEKKAITKGIGTLKGTTFTINYGDKYPAIYNVKENGNWLDGSFGNGTGKESMTKKDTKTGFKGY